MKIHINLMNIVSLVMLCTALMTACSVFDNQANNQEIKDVKKSPVSQAFVDYESIADKNYDKFTLPKIIEAYDVKNAYVLECNSPKNSISNDTAVEIYKLFYGDRFDEANIAYDENGGILYTAGDNTSAYWGHDISLFSEDYTGGETEIGKNYDAYANKDDTISLGGKDMTVKSIAEEINGGLKRILLPFYSEFEIKVETLSVIGDDIEFACSLLYDGIPFQYAPSEYLSHDANNMVYWMFSTVNGVYGSGGFKMIQAAPPMTVTDKSELSELVSVDEAVKLLDKELAEYIDYEITDITLMYCCLTSQPTIDRTNTDNEQQAESLTEEYNMKAKTFTPMWCFEIKTDSELISKQYIKLNAVTGEMFMDIRI